MNHLVPCPSCGRHVRASEARCPFCEAEQGAAPAPRPVPSGRLSRAATLAFGAMLGAAAATGCGSDGDDDSGGAGDAGESAGGDADDGAQTGGGPVANGGSLPTPVYGAPAFGGTLNEPDPGSGGTGNRAENGGTGNRAESGGTGNRDTGGANTGGRMTAPRGGTANAGSPSTGGQIFAPVYGAPPEPQGGKPASGTGGRDPGSIPMPLYGAPPSKS